MDKISEEFARILVKRIKSALTTAKYEPAKADIDALALEVVRPYIITTRKGTEDGTPIKG